MTILEPRIIAPDSAHWAKWIDGTWSSNPVRRQKALALHDRLVERGCIPLLSWHHMEELLGGEDDGAARARIAFIQELPLVAWLRLPGENAGLGSIVQVLGAEAIAAAEGDSDLISVRDRARVLLLRIGTGREAIGEDGWVWEAVRPALCAREDHTDMVAALAPLRHFDDSRTIGEISKLAMNSPGEMHLQLERIYANVLHEATQSLNGDSVRAKSMADEFVRRVVASLPPPGTSPRDMLVSSLIGQGVDEHEIRDECVLADLNRLGLFRSQLRIIASKTGYEFETLKRIPMNALPSRLIEGALRLHGQKRRVRPGSDVNDEHLAVLAAYCDVLFVDKRTAEDFRRARRKEPRLSRLTGEISKAADFDALLMPAG